MRIWLVWLLVFAFVAPARGDDVSDREEARRAFEAGQAADRQRDWQTAIDHYLRANDLVPHPNTVYNIAHNYQRLGKLREAGKWYSKYLVDAPDSPDRDKVVKALRALEMRAGTITVRSVPNNARVLIDGKLVGATPYADHIAGGSHRVAVELDGMRDERTIKIEYGEPRIEDFTLRGQSGTLRVVGGPEGALVTIDTIPSGQVPLTIPLVPGVHRIRVSQQGFTPYDTTATIEPNREFVVEARLPRALGTFGDSKPPGPSSVAYLLGAGGGVDARGDGGLFLAELGARTLKWDASIRLGKTVGLTAIDLMVRWRFTQSRIAPFLSIGYTVLRGSEGDMDTNGAGYFATGGLRVDIARGEHTTISLVAEAGVRVITGIESAPGEATATSDYLVPVMTSLQVSYK